MAPITLFFIPYAGGSASVSFKWKKSLLPQIKLVPLELAGRGIRSGEPLKESIEEMSEDLMHKISEEIAPGNPYAIYGHSMGTMISFELYYKLVAGGYGKPAHLFVSGGRAPHVPRNSSWLHDLPADQFRTHLQRYGQLSEAIFDNQELYDYFMPVLRADFKAVELYKYTAKAALLHCPITALTGMTDNTVTLQDAEAWAQHTDQQFRMFTFEGGHFFIHDEVERITHIINETLEQITVTSSIQK
ncbi:alpha/beta fold hydrolase [Paenibacillus sp. FSL M8-0228]|uniref:thioesterase II family protein n=1 Tax=Paenibacillus TaxID=44249 RepID=UPI00083D1C6A|nr:MULTISPECIES: alpha/beta fold hydrolase [Paenibacillus]MBO3287484.1 thioesterase [Paenibacillus polymyxa]MBP1312104.1 surfactin synthase thioesterase subunit [Paenibacillus sp. 1182]ODB56226.1 gramicidin biosynthesis protein [Paenibacillus polymyxa]